MKARHQGDLVWRFQYAEETVEAARGEALLSARDRVARIDAALAKLPTEPVSFARALSLRYGPEEAPRETRIVLRENAALAAITLEATIGFERVGGAPPRAGSHDVDDWIAALCARIGKREATGADTVLLDEIRRGAEDLLREAESAYEAATEGRLTPDSKGARTMRKLKPFYTVPELARALGMSRWTVRRWLDVNRIPYEIRRREGGRGGRILVLLSELRTYAPSYFASMREELEVEGEE